MLHGSVFLDRHVIAPALRVSTALKGGLRIRQYRIATTPTTVSPHADKTTYRPGLSDATARP